jgi:hypothetical protein
MTLHLELSPDQASWLGKEAAQQGVDEADVLISALDQQRRKNDPFQELSDDPSTLKKGLEKALPETVRTRYEELSFRCRDEKLTVEEHGELIELINIVESHHAGMMARAAKLAKIQGADFSKIAAQYGLIREPK